MVNILRDLKEVIEAYEFRHVREIFLPEKYYDEVVNYFNIDLSYPRHKDFELVVKNIIVSPCHLLSDCGMVAFSNGRQPYLFKIGGTSGQKEETA